MTRSLPLIDYLTHPLYGGMLQPHPDFTRLALQSLEPLIDEARAVEADRRRQFGYRYGHAEAIGRTLAETGTAGLQLSAAAVDAIQREVQPLVDRVRSRLHETREARLPVKYRTALETIGEDANPQLWAAIDRAVRDAGVYEITAAFFDAPGARLRSCGLLVNQPDQDWATRLYRDVEVEAPPTAGFHIDSAGKCFVKAVLYLNDVGPDQGPFGLVRGSHRWGEGSDDRIFRRAFDKSDLVIRSAKKRRLFISLPREMQVKAEFGGDMLPDAPETRALLDDEIVATGPRGQLNLFDPEAVHRGGNVRHGERHAVLITTGALW